MRYRPRFTLRTIFALILFVSIPMGWFAYQIHWIHARRTFVERYGEIRHIGPYSQPQAPWPLYLFGERGYWGIMSPPALIDDAHSLFPEAGFYADPDQRPIE